MHLKMLMMDNFIHADLHPGNVLVRMEAVTFHGPASDLADAIAMPQPAFPL